MLRKVFPLSGECWEWGGGWITYSVGSVMLDCESPVQWSVRFTSLMDRLGKPSSTNAAVSNAPLYYKAVIKILLIRIQEIQRCPNLPTAQIWPRPISFCFPGSNPAWKDTILGLLKTCCRLPWRMLCKRSQFKTSRRATTRGRTAGNGILMLKDVILKNIKCV